MKGRMIVSTHNNSRLQFFELVNKIAIVFLCIVVIIFLFFVLVPGDIFKTIVANWEVGGRLEADEYLAFIIGVPVALLTSVIAILIAWGTAGVSRTQLEVEQQSYTLSALGIALRKLEQISIPLSIVRDFANEIEDIGEDLVHEAEEQIEAEESLKTSDKATRNGVNGVEAKNAGSSIVLEETIRRFRELSDEISISDPFWFAALACERKNLKGNRTVNGALIDLALNADTRGISDLTNISNIIARFAKYATIEEFRTVLRWLPENASSVEIVGAFLYFADEDLDRLAYFESFWANSGSEVKLFNIGAAFLVDYLTLMPSRQSIETVIRDTFHLDPKAPHYSALNHLPDFQEMFGESLRTDISKIKSNPGHLCYFARPLTDESGELDGRISVSRVPNTFGAEDEKSLKLYRRETSKTMQSPNHLSITSYAQVTLEHAIFANTGEKLFSPKRRLNSRKTLRSTARLLSRSPHIDR